ncbi:MAG: hypothetical protein HRT87_00495 [Legionellales bacterium]|nr:hypothetical protein [Legionellales bacterium]
MLRSSNKLSEQYILFFITFLVAIIFSNWDFKQLMLVGSQSCCQNYGVLQHGFFFKPILSIAAVDFIRNTFGIIGLVLIGQVIFPSIIFYMLVIIFSRYLKKIWAITIGLVSVFSFPDCSYRDFLINLIKTAELSKVSEMLPGIANFPIPALSILIFLLAFYISIKQVKLSDRRVSLLTLLWSLQIYVNAIDGLFGICFWFTYFVVRLYRKNNEILNSFKSIFVQIAIFLTTCVPALSFTDFSLGPVSTGENFDIITYFTLYIFIPIIVTSILFVFHKIDPYELLHKFSPLYLLMVLEIVLVIAAYYFSVGVDLEILTNRIPLFFLHFYYYIPVIFYASRQYYSFEIDKDGGTFKNVVRKMIFITFNPLCYIYLPLIMIFIILFALASSMNFVG